MIQKCLFPVAGYGTRFLPATKSTPKEMLPVVNKPLLQYGVEEALEAGMSNCAFVTGRGKRAIADHFDISYELEHQISGTSKEKYLEGIRNVIGALRAHRPPASTPALAARAELDRGTPQSLS